MNKPWTGLSLIILIICSLHVFSASDTLKTDSIHRQIQFISPVEIPISLAGNFGELRPGHFHAGLDIRTSGREGLNVRAIASGYVSRVGISLNGYGKVVYVVHANGFTSVYAHLSSFYPELEQFIKDYQYKNRCFEFDIKIDSAQFILEQGELVGLSGNTGGSAGPHLHFEIRNTITERPINPLHFGIPVRDNIAPTLHYLGIYPMNESSAVDGVSAEKMYKLEKVSGKYRIQGGVIPRVKGKIGFGLEARDKTNGSPFRCGIYSKTLVKDGKTVFVHQLDSFSFDNTRSINAHVDYYQWKKKRRRVQRSWLMEGNRLQTYSNVVNRGQFFFLDSAVHHLEYTVKDFHNNSTNLEFKVKSNQEDHTLKQKTQPDQILSFGSDNSYTSDELKIYFTASCLYEETPLYIKKDPAIGRCVTPRYHINSLYDPLNDYMKVSINVSHIPKHRRSKLVVVSLDAKSQILAPEGGTIDSSWIVASTRSFGPYTVMEDTTAPKISLKTSLSTALKKGQKIWFGLTDDIAGIKKYEASIDGEWHLVEYQKNKKTGYVKLDRAAPLRKSRTLELKITDAVGNVRSRKYNLVY